MRGKQILFNGKEVVLREIEITDPTGDEIILRSEWTHVSMGTERNLIRMGLEKEREYELGYSLVGIVDKKGPKAKIELGTKVLAAWCPHASIAKALDNPYYVVKVPDGLTPDIASIGILGSVAFHIVERATIRVGESVAVFGQGIVGSLIMQIAKMSGASPIIAVDIDEKKLKIAREYGADECVNPGRVDLPKVISDLTRGKMLSVAIEATGKAGAVRGATDSLGEEGRLVLSSFTYDTISFSLHGDIVERELTIIGACQPRCPVERVHYYPFSQVRNRTLAMQWLKEGKLRVEELISHRVRSCDAPKLYPRLMQGEKDITGVLIDWA